jgi:hypothetical protein
MKNKSSAENITAQHTATLTSEPAHASPLTRHEPTPSRASTPTPTATSNQTAGSPPEIRLQKPRQRNGKVARLAKTLRDKISQGIVDGVPYETIIQSLGEDSKGLTKNCISTYKTGGHKDWLREQQLLHECRLRHELVFDLAREDASINAYTAANKLAASLICEAVAEIGPESLRAAVRENPLNILRMLNSLSRLTMGGIRCERHLVDTKAGDPLAERECLGLSPEGRAFIERELKLL